MKNDKYEPVLCLYGERDGTICVQRKIRTHEDKAKMCSYCLGFWQGPVR